MNIDLIVHKKNSTIGSDSNIEIGNDKGKLTNKRCKIDNQDIYNKECKHGLMSLEVISYYKTLATNKNNEKIIYYTRTFLLKKDSKWTSRLAPLKDGEEGILKIKKSKKASCTCFETLKKYNEENDKKILRNRSVLFISLPYLNKIKFPIENLDEIDN